MHSTENIYNFAFEIRNYIFYITHMKRAIIIGATSGLGREIALNLQREGWLVAVAGRRVELLKEFENYFVCSMFYIDICGSEIWL